jgi:hypothetical protein
MHSSPLEKLIVAHLLKKFLAFCETQSFIFGVHKEPATGRYLEGVESSPHSVRL